MERPIHANRRHISRHERKRPGENVTAFVSSLSWAQTREWDWLAALIFSRRSIPILKHNGPLCLIGAGWASAHIAKGAMNTQLDALWMRSLKSSVQQNMDRAQPASRKLIRQLPGSTTSGRVAQYMREDCQWPRT